MSCDAADSAAATGSRAGEIEMRIIGFGTPEWRFGILRRAFQKGEIEVPVEDVSTRQTDVLFEIERGFHFNRQRTVAAESDDGTSLPGKTGTMTFRKGLNKRLADKINIPFHIADDPLRAVARGTGIALKNVDNYSFLMR